jgi:protein-tyrosine phosphatase
MLSEGLVHFIASDAHGVASRRPRLRRAFERVAELAGEEAAINVCCRWPAQVAAGGEAPAGRWAARAALRGWRRLLSRTKAA